MGRFEFSDRLEQIKALLAAAPPESTWIELYGSNLEFRSVVNRCLELNHLDPDWLTPATVQELLIGRQEGDSWLPGWLVELNFPTSPTTLNPSPEEPSLAEVLAVLSTHCQGLVEAIELAQNVPAAILLDTLAAKAELAKTPEVKAQETKKAKLQELRQDYARIDRTQI